MYSSLIEINQDIIACKKCNRLLKWSKLIAQKKTKRFQNEEYWAKPVPSFGDPSASLLIVGLAPAAHGANRTGRMFTGDRSGLWLYKALYDFGFSNKPESLNLHDGLKLTNCWITAALHCAPPSNIPQKEEILNCNNFLLHELILLNKLKIILALGKIAFDAILLASMNIGWIETKKKFTFEHGAIYNLTNDKFLITSYHPSQQNTFTKKLTHKMFDDIFLSIKQILNKGKKT